jgi:hypothetical protein
MKALTAFAAVAALIAGISIASAQTSNMSKSGAMGSESTHATGSGKFCISGTGGSLDCRFASLASCQKAVKGSETCQARPSSTTGSKY